MAPLRRRGVIAAVSTSPTAPTVIKASNDVSGLSGRSGTQSNTDVEVRFGSSPRHTIACCALISLFAARLPGALHRRLCGQRTPPNRVIHRINSTQDRLRDRAIPDTPLCPRQPTSARADYTSPTKLSPNGQRQQPQHTMSIQGRQTKSRGLGGRAGVAPNTHSGDSASAI